MTAPGEHSEPGGDPSNHGGGAGDGETVTDEAIAAMLDQELADVADVAGDPSAGADAAGLDPEQISEEAVVALIAQRDDYLDQLQRAKAEFANARRRSDERAAQQRAQAAAGLVEKLLPVLDSCDIAIGQGIEEIRPICDSLFDVLAGQGLTRIDADGQPFDPELHEAVMFEQTDGGSDGEQVVTETLRAGYRWNDRVLRAAMVKVQG